MLMGYVLLLPIMALVAVFMLIPFLRGIQLSFFGTKYGYGDMDFVFLKNYTSIIKNEHFLIALKKSMIWVVISLVINTVVPTAMAILMNREYRGKQVSIALVLIPWITPLVGMAMMSKWFLEPEIGVLNVILKNLGVIKEGINFLGSSELAFPTLIILNFWQFCPFGILINMAALTTIPQEQYEAMWIDGAGELKILKHLVLPAIGRLMGFMLFYGVAYTFNSYGLTYLLTGGGPNFSSYTIPIMIYEKAYKSINIGQSTALATMVSVFLFLFGFIYFKYIYKVSEE